MGTQRLSSIETKRFIFEPLSAFLEARDISLANRTVINDIAVIAILGTRSIGKTTLLKQLYDTAPDVSEYRDCSKLSESFDFEDVGLSIILDTIIKKFDRRKPFEGTHRTVVCST